VTVVVWTPTAETQLVLIGNYIAEDSLLAAEAVVKRIREKGNSLVEFPNRGRPGAVADTRELVITRTPYIISYEYEIIGDTVWILSVFHSAQDDPQEALH
jgi:plasmid stabilization system protein ParE